MSQHPESTGEALMRGPEFSSLGALEKGAIVEVRLAVIDPENGAAYLVETAGYPARTGVLANSSRPNTVCLLPTEGVSTEKLPSTHDPRDQHSRNGVAKPNSSGYKSLYSFQTQPFTKDGVTWWFIGRKI